MEDLSLHILDIVENAVAAGASRVSVSVNENAARDLLVLRVADDGRGMSREERARAFDPFFTTGRKRTGSACPCSPIPPRPAAAAWSSSRRRARGRGSSRASGSATSTGRRSPGWPRP
ncbi:MAG: ATP-binding protein [Candidatus Moduliflexus flocculans]|nr:ATP-binding protein [Candidatus Moduliflexus flocculans]